jgi:cytochrome b
MSGTEYPIWDHFVRLAHWYLPVALGVMWWSGDQGRMEIHQWVGSSVLCVVAARVIWGFVGSQPARLASFLVSPAKAWRYLRHGGRYAGHNPLGGWSVLAMWVLLLLQGGSGLFSRDDVLFEGPFAYWAGERSGTLTEWHLINWQLLQALVALHLLAIAWYQWRRRQPLIQAMWRGRAEYKVAAAPPKPMWVALLIMAVLALGLWGLIALAPQAPSYY